MADGKSSRLPSILTGLRGVLMLLGGLYAFIFPGPALTILVIVAGILFLADGVLGLWAITFGAAKTGNFWFDVVRNVLSIIVGLLILVAPLLAAIVTVTLLVYLVALQALIVGVMEIYVISKEREHYAKIWPVLLSGAAYVLFALVLAIWPFFSATVLVMFGGLLMMVFSVGLFTMARRLYKAGF